MVSPVIPGLTDHEMPAILAATAAAGASFAGYAALRLPYAVAPLFQEWLARHLPEKKDNVLARVRSPRDGKPNNSEFGVRMRGEGIFAERISQMFHVGRRKVGMPEDGPELSVAAFRRSEARQLRLGFSIQ
jgi:DNA repair photolyase